MTKQYCLRLVLTETQKKMFDYVNACHPELEGNKTNVMRECIRREALRCQMERLDEKERAQEIEDRVDRLTDEQVKCLIVKMCEEPQESPERRAENA